MHLEIGGGMNPKAGFTNLDQCPTADIHHDLNVLPWPVADDSCEEIYSSHCLEHLADAHTALHEICRVGTLGATVEIRVPDGDVAMIPGHIAHLSETWWRNLCQYIPASFPHKTRRLKIVSLTRNPNHVHFPAARKEFPAMGTQTLLSLFPRASFEIVIVATIAVT